MLETKNTELLAAGAMKFTQIMPGAYHAQAWGNPEGEHGSFIKLKAGFKAPLHTHTHDVKLVIISGTLIHGEHYGSETRLPSGSYCFIPGGARHTTACTRDSDCLFYEELPGKFDLNLIR